jgi:hypothetical protein
MPTWTQEKETILGESVDVQLRYNPPTGWSLDANTPGGCMCVGVRVVRTADGDIHRLYRYVVTPEVLAECEAKLARAAEMIRKTDFESDKVRLLLAISKKKEEVAKKQQDIAALETEYAEKYASREATAVLKV